MGTAVFEAYSIFAFVENDIWFMSGGSFVHWDGVSFKRICFQREILQGGLNRIWATSGDNLYGAGENGTVIPYNGYFWRAMENGTNVHLTDIFGSPDGEHIWTCGYFDDRLGTYLLKTDKFNRPLKLVYDGTHARNIVRADSLSGLYVGVFSMNQWGLYVLSTAGLYRMSTPSHGEAKRTSFTSGFLPSFPRALRGNGHNDLVLAGEYTMLAHYNGSSWRYFNELRDPKIHFFSVAQRGDMIAAVGLVSDPINGLGIIYRGRR